MLAQVNNAGALAKQLSGLQRDLQQHARNAAQREHRRGGGRGEAGEALALTLSGMEKSFEGTAAHFRDIAAAALHCVARGVFQAWLPGSLFAEGWLRAAEKGAEAVGEEIEKCEVEGEEELCEQLGEEVDALCYFTQEPSFHKLFARHMLCMWTDALLRQLLQAVEASSQASLPQLWAKVGSPTYRFYCAPYPPLLF
jgi:hypothetical protein